MEETVDLSALDVHYANDALGACAYRPKVLLKIVLCGYARGLTGSRRIERACRENVQFMALSGEAKPDHATIAAFISRSPEAIKSVFQEVLLVCDAAGLIGREHFAIDGVKLPSNASKDLSGRMDELQAKAAKLDRAIERILEAHQIEDVNDAHGDLETHAAKQIETLNRQRKRLGTVEPPFGNLRYQRAWIVSRYVGRTRSTGDGSCMRWCTTSRSMRIVGRWDEGV